MTSRRLRSIRSFLSVCLAAIGGSARGDQIVIAGKSHLGAKVSGYEEGRVSFRTADGRMQSSWVDQISLLIVDRGGVLEDFNQAERLLAAGDVEKAALRYERAARLADGFWPELAVTRLITVYDRTAQIDKATMNFIRAARGRHAGPAAAARTLPGHLPEKRDSRIGRALEQLDVALSQDPGDSVRMLFELSRYDLLRRAGDSRAARMVGTVAVFTIPEALQTEAVCSVVREALSETLKSDPSAERTAALDRAIRDCPDASLGGLLLVRGETLLRTAQSHEDFIRASWPFLRAAAHGDTTPEAAEGLLGGGRALVSAGRGDYAAKLFEQAAAHPSARESARQSAAEMLDRLRTSNAGGKPQ